METTVIGEYTILHELLMKQENFQNEYHTFMQILPR